MLFDDFLDLMDIDDDEKICVKIDDDESIIDAYISFLRDDYMVMRDLEVNSFSFARDLNMIMIRLIRGDQY